jgi:hypothetical protein
VERRPASEEGRKRADLEGCIIDDLSDLACLLGVSRRDLRAAIGVPWHRALPTRYDRDFGPLFVGREGTSAAICCLGTDAELIGAGGSRSRVATRVVVGMAVGRRREDGRLGWSLDGSLSSIVRVTGTEPHAFLAALKSAATRAVREKAPQLTTCRSCQEMVGPELRDDDLCLRCLPAAGLPADSVRARTGARLMVV